MLDSLLTLTKGAVGWMLGTIVVCLVLDRFVSAVTGLPATMFLLFAIGILVFLLVAGIYTLSKSAWHHMRPHGT